MSEKNSPKVSLEELLAKVELNVSLGNTCFSEAECKAMQAVLRSLASARDALEAGANSLLVEQTRFEERARRTKSRADTKLAESVGAHVAILRELVKS
jgi:hypothetical protein